MRYFFSTLFLLCLFAGTGLLLLFLFQRRLLYPAPGYQPSETLVASVEKMEFESGYYLFLPPLSGQSASVAGDSDTAEGDSGSQASPVIIHAHGNAELAYDRVYGFDELRRLGVAVALVEYPSYAGASGKPSLDTINTLMLATYDSVTTRADIDATKVISYGRSIGGGAASLLAKSRAVSALVLESTFSSLPRLVSELGYPSRLLRDRYDNLAIVRQFKPPVFIFHGTQDTLIDFKHAETMHAAAPHAVFKSADCGHSDCPSIEQELISFLHDNQLITIP